MEAVEAREIVYQDFIKFLCMRGQKVTDLASLRKLAREYKQEKEV